MRSDEPNATQRQIIDIQSYLPMMSEFDMSEAEKLEFLEQMLLICKFFVDEAFD